MRQCFAAFYPVRTASTLVLPAFFAIVVTACDYREQGPPPDPVSEVPEPPSPAPSARGVVQLPDGESRGIVRGELYDEPFAPELLDDAHQCLLRNRTDPSSIRITHIFDRLDHNRVPLTVVGVRELLHGVPVMPLEGLFSCRRPGHATGRRSDSKPLIAETEAQVTFVEAAIQAFPELRHSRQYQPEVRMHAVVHP